jgi:hypothetical protein
MAVLLSSVATSFLLLQNVQAQAPVFITTNRDLVLSFRKTGANNVLEIDLGQAKTYYTATPGTTKPVSQLSSTLLNSAFSGDLTSLSWSVAGSVLHVGDGGDASVPNSTLWVTAPRTDPATPATAWVRRSASAQGATATEINSILVDGSQYSGSTYGVTNSTATTTLVPAGNGFDAGSFLGASGNYLNTFQGDVENTTPSDFDTAGLPSRSDLYQLYPDSTSTQPPAKYLGYFELEPAGTMVFVAGPPATTVSLSVAGNTSTVSFPTVGQGTYTLYYTNSAGLLSPIHTWATNSSVVIGDGKVDSFQQTSTDPNRFYSVGVH